VRRCTPPGCLPLGPAVHPAEGCRHWMKSLTPSARTTRTCSTPCGTVENSNIPSGMANRSSHYHLPRHEESLASPGSLNSRKRGGVKLFPRVDREVNIIFGGHGAQETRGNKSLMTDRSWWAQTVPQLHTGDQSTR
jgi:hypothetical protein